MEAGFNGQSIQHRNCQDEALKKGNSVEFDRSEHGSTSLGTKNSRSGLCVLARCVLVILWSQKILSLKPLTADWFSSEYSLARRILSDRDATLKRLKNILDDVIVHQLVHQRLQSI